MQVYGYPFFNLRARPLAFPSRLTFPAGSRDAVFFMHGVLDTSLGWVSNGTTGSQAFNAFDMGMDVWLGNSRNNPPRFNDGVIKNPAALFHMQG